MKKDLHIALTAIQLLLTLIAIIALFMNRHETFQDFMIVTTIVACYAPRDEKPSAEDS